MSCPVSLFCCVLNSDPKAVLKKKISLSLYLTMQSQSSKYLHFEQQQLKIFK